MIDGQIPRLPALIREALAVLAAILAAFALDAWWEARVERADMLDALDAVAVEIERNLELIQFAIEYNDGRAALVAELVLMTPADLEGFPEEEFNRFDDLPSYELVTLELGGATAFIEGGFLPTLDDRALRAEIAGLPRLQPELDVEAEAVTVASQGLEMALFVAAPMSMFLETGQRLRPEDRDRATSAGDFIALFLEDEEALRRLVARTFFLTIVYGEELLATRARLEEVRARIESYLET